MQKSDNWIIFYESTDLEKNSNLIKYIVLDQQN